MFRSMWLTSFSTKRAILLLVFGSLVFTASGQERTIEISVPDYVLKISPMVAGQKTEDRIHRFIVGLSPEGLIDRFSWLNGSKSSSQYRIDFSLGPSFVSVKNGQGRTTKLEWDTDKIVVTRQVGTSESNVEELHIAPRSGTLYSSASKALVLTKKSLEERAVTEPFDGQMFLYSDLVTAERYRVSGNVNSKMKYRRKAGSVEIIFSYNNDGAFDFSGEPIVIQGGSIHSKDSRSNIINYLVLRQIGIPFAEMFFPLVFLGDSMWNQDFGS